MRPDLALDLTASLGDGPALGVAWRSRSGCCTAACELRLFRFFAGCKAAVDASLFCDRLRFSEGEGTGAAASTSISPLPFTAVVWSTCGAAAVSSSNGRDPWTVGVGVSEEWPGRGTEDASSTSDVIGLKLLSLREDLFRLERDGHGLFVEADTFASSPLVARWPPRVFLANRISEWQIRLTPFQLCLRCLPPL